MNNTLKYLGIGVVGVIVGIIALLFFGKFGSAPTGGSTNYGGDLVVEALTVNSTLTQTGTATLGSRGTSYTETIGGITYTYVSKTLTTSTTTPCAIQAPTATSTLLRDQSGLFLSVSSTTASNVTLAKATTAYATTTVIATSTTAANALLTMTAASTTVIALNLDDAITDSIFAPSEYFVAGMGLQDGTTRVASGQLYSPTGVCKAVWASME